MEALGRVELPTNGLGNKGFHPSLNRISHLQTDSVRSFGGESSQTAVIWQRIWQRKPKFPQRPQGKGHPTDADGANGAPLEIGGAALHSVVPQSLIFGTVIR